ncbi:MAG: GNAT family N-acetyltransferase [Gaiellales bacterium]
MGSTPGVTLSVPGGEPLELGAVAEIVALVNEAYTGAERGIWLGSVERTNAAEVAAHAALGELVIAWMDGRPVGAVFVRRLADGIGWFGALGVAPAHAGRGIGGRLVAYAEAVMRDAGAAEMRLELLVPEGGHPHTERLAAWYRRLGYRQTETADLADVDPGTLSHLRVPCSVAIMRRAL